MLGYLEGFVAGPDIEMEIKNIKNNNNILNPINLL